MAPVQRESGNPGRVTIAEVAARAGVGASTVSRVLNGGQVSVRARTRVLAVMNELDYRPQASARSLVTGSTGTLALVIPFFTHPSAIERVRGVLAAVGSTEYELVVCNVATPAHRDEYLGRRAPFDRSDGMLIVSLAPTDDEARSYLRAGAPVVLVDAFHPLLPSLRTDDVAGGMLVTRHLVELGHERIAFVGDRTTAASASSPATGGGGHRRALEEAGLAATRTAQREGPHGRHVAHRLTRELLSLDPSRRRRSSPPRDTQALGVLEAARFEGFDVPGDLSVVGFDDIEVAPYVGLTTVHQPLEDSGRRGVERLVAALGDEDEAAARRAARALARGAPDHRAATMTPEREAACPTTRS